MTAAAVIAFGFTARAQDDNMDEGLGLKVGIHGGFPFSLDLDADSSQAVNFGADVAYLLPITDGFSAGLASGYTHFTTKLFDSASEVEDFGFIPVAAEGRFFVFEDFYFEGDIGYAFYMGKGDGKGGLYYQPKACYTMEEMMDFFVSFKGINAGDDTINTIGIGFAYRF